MCRKRFITVTTWEPDIGGYQVPGCLVIQQGSSFKINAKKGWRYNSSVVEYSCVRPWIQFPVLKNNNKKREIIKDWLLQLWKLRSHDLLSVSWKPRRAGNIVPVQAQRPESKGTDMQVMVSVWWPENQNSKSRTEKNADRAQAKQSKANSCFLYLLFYFNTIG